jgi:hypothetical protein
MRRRREVVAIVAAAWLCAVGGCATGLVAGRQAPGAPPAAGAQAPAPLPPLPDPAPALPCDGAAVLCVDAAAGAAAPDGSAQQPFAAVGDAVAAAGPATTVQVAAGVYEESVTVTGTEDLRLVGGFPPGDFSLRDPAVHETRLQGAGDRAVVAVVESRGVHLEGFRLTGGGGSDNGYRIRGGGVFVDETASDTSIVANRIDGNGVDRGADPGDSHGGGIAAYGAGTTTIVGNVIENNRGGRGAGIAAGGTVVVRGNTVTGNVGVGDHGGGLYLYGQVSVIGNRVEGNSIGTGPVLGTDYGWGGGAIVFGDETSAEFRGNVVTGNTALSAGSGVFVDDGADATLVGELYYANVCNLDGGVGLFVDSGGQTPTVVQVANVTIAGHDCPESSSGGNALLAGVSDEDAPLTQVSVSVASSIFWDNAGMDVRSTGPQIQVTYSLSEEPVDGTGNVRGDPLFVDAVAADFHLGPGSPAIDAGDPAADVGDEPDGGGGRIDMGHTGGTGEASGSA